MRRESSIQKDVLLELGSRKGVRLFRNNVGRGYQGNIAKKQGTTILLMFFRVIRFGLFKGSHDLIGWREVVITPDMVGKKIAQFFSVETKTETGKMSKFQKVWRDNVNAAGGLAVTVRSKDEATKI